MAIGSANARKTTTKVRPDAIAVLKEEHRLVERLFRRFEHAGDGAVAERHHLAESMAARLTEHTAVEETVIYPWARAHIVDADTMILEAIEEHRVVQGLLTDIATTAPVDERFVAKVTVLIESVRHHVNEEETQLFRDLRAQATRHELLELGDALRAAKRTAPTSAAPNSGASGLAAVAMSAAYSVGRGLVGRIGSIARVG